MRYTITVKVRRHWKYKYPVFDAYLNSTSGMGITRTEARHPVEAIYRASNYGGCRRNITEVTFEPPPLDWLEGESPIPADGEKPTGKQWMYWYSKVEDKR